jgi:NAD(P)H dehydrogenase (quinone)
MNILIVHAHPEPNSFCAALKQSACDYFLSSGHSVEISDLYAMQFNPVGGRVDFTTVSDPDYFKYQAEQVHAFQNDGFVPEIKQEMDKLERADLLIFNFPLWWFGLPAILKGWVDRVLAMGFVYGNGKGVYDHGVYPHKRALVCMTTGGPQPAYGDRGRNGELDKILFPIQHGMFYFTGMTVLPPFISFGPARLSEDARIDELNRYRKYLAQLDEHSPVYYANPSA